MTNPYELQPPDAFWRSAVAQRDPLSIDRLWKPRFAITSEHKIATAGSCFAQHIGRALVNAGYSWFNAEPAPPALSASLKEEFNYDVFSFRTGNIYTAALLRQWIDWALGTATEASEVWVDEKRYYDPFRPAIEPGGFASEFELFASRKVTLGAIRDALRTCNVIVFTLGLTEAWLNTRSGHVYPMCPGTIAGRFDPDLHIFRNYRYDEIYAQLMGTFDAIKGFNPEMRFLLTVSPVPLTATASREHVLVATNYSKATLRAVAGDVASSRSDTDYFPSYEIISSFPFRGMFFEPNMRNVSRMGVNFVMQSFFACLNGASRGDASGPERRAARDSAGLVTGTASDAVEQVHDVVCEEILLEGFQRESA